MGNQAPALNVNCCTPVCCAVCLHEDTLKDSSAKDSGDAYQANFANSAPALGGSDAAAEEIALSDSLEKELVQEVEFWRLENIGPVDDGAVFGISASRSRGDAEVFKPEPAVAARWAGVGNSDPHPSASWPGIFQAEPSSSWPGIFQAGPGSASDAASQPPPTRWPPDPARKVDRGAWTEAASANLDARGPRGANRGAGATAVRGDAAEAARMPFPAPHPPFENGCAEAQSSSDEDGFVGFYEIGADLSAASGPDMSAAAAPTHARSKGRRGSDRSVF